MSIRYRLFLASVAAFAACGLLAAIVALPSAPGASPAGALVLSRQATDHTTRDVRASEMHVSHAQLAAQIARLDAVAHARHLAHEERLARHLAHIAHERVLAERAAAARAAVAARARARAVAPAAPAAPAAPSGSPQQIAQQLLDARGWGGQFGCLDSINTRESGWSVTAQNPSSGAYGIPQALPGDKMGPGWQTSAYVQLRWQIDDYIPAQYGTPCGAWAYWQGHGYY